MVEAVTFLLILVCLFIIRIDATPNKILHFLCFSEQCEVKQKECLLDAAVGRMSGRHDIFSVDIS